MAGKRPPQPKPQPKPGWAECAERTDNQKNKISGMKSNPFHEKKKIIFIGETPLFFRSKQAAFPHCGRLRMGKGVARAGEGLDV